MQPCRRKIVPYKKLTKTKKRVLAVKISLRGNRFIKGDVVRLITDDCPNCGRINLQEMRLGVRAVISEHNTPYSAEKDISYEAKFPNGDWWYVCALCTRLERMADEKDQSTVQEGTESTG